jgi:hypothetical protein
MDFKIRVLTCGLNSSSKCCPMSGFGKSGEFVLDELRNFSGTTLHLVVR